MSSDFFLVGSFKLVPERGEYIGVVCKQQGTTMEVLCVGAEVTEFAILEWIRDTIKLMRSAGKENVQAPDMYDRMPKIVN